MAILPLLSHQVAIAALPEPYCSSPVLRDMSLSPVKTGIETMDLVGNTTLTLPVSDWAQVLNKELSSNLSNSVGGLVTSLLSLVLPDRLVDEIITVPLLLPHDGI